MKEAAGSAMPSGHCLEKCFLNSRNWCRVLLVDRIMKFDGPLCPFLVNKLSGSSNFRYRNFYCISIVYSKLSIYGLFYADFIHCTKSIKWMYNGEVVSFHLHVSSSNLLDRFQQNMLFELSINFHSGSYLSNSSTHIKLNNGR
jgi:hypothetical protein